MPKYKIGVYTQAQLNNKRKYIRKKRYNTHYRNSLTIRQKNINEKRAITFLLVSLLFGATYAFVMTSNNFTIDGAIVIEHLPSEAVALAVNPQSIGEVQSVIATSPSDEVKNEIIKQAQNFGLDENMMLALATCENDTFDPKRKNPTSTATGIFQYVVGTWNETQSAKQGIERTDYKANIREAMIDVSNGESWRWRDCGYDLRAMGYNF